jgi:DNA-binding MarR family transcriptional regulator
MTLHYSAADYKPKSSIGYLVRRASTIIISRVEAVFSIHEITFVQWLVLVYLRDGMASTAAELCRELCYDSGALTRLIDQLCERGFIERERSTQDRRIVALKLTDAGRASVAALMPLVVDCLNVALTDFTRDEVQTLARLLEKLIEGVEAAQIPIFPRQAEPSP